ncbi:MAG: energy-coupling factor transporter transmembrane protein EcfT [Lachnospiraceae bacterium]|nr:energy-coupling factor transporter transmembrane protein EcfT [Lachnospiraceae bacterium]
MTEYSEYNPIVTFVYFLAVAGLAMFIMNPVLLTVSLLGSVVCFCLKRNKGEKANVLIFVGLFVVLALINPLFHHNGVTVLFLINDNPITLEALAYGVTASVMVISVLFWFRSFSALMTGDKLLYVFGRFSPKFSLMISMALRYIPLFAERSKKIKDARRAMGAYEEENLWDSVKGGVKVFISLTGQSLEKGIITADSMEARGYGSGKRTFFSRYVFKKKDGIALVLILLLTAAVMAAKMAGVLDFSFYPAAEGELFSVWAVGAYACYGVLTLLPLMSEITEREKWRYLRSKI